MSNYFNDSPIENAADDRYGISPFCTAIAKSILNIKNPVGTTIALNGPWGSGKSSAINLIRAELDKAKEATLIVTEFKCWWYRGEEALALAFLQNLHTVLKDKLGDKIKGLIPDITRHVLQAGPVIGQIVALASGANLAALISGSSKFVSTFFPKGDTVEATFRKLSEVLQQENRRFLVIVDDIDRLGPEETLAIFRLVKSIGHLPNVMYLLVFDRELADRVVQERYPSEGPHFLEKIVQAGFEIPRPLQTDLNDAVLSSIESTCGTPGEPALVRTMNLFYDSVAPYMTTPRHVARYQNAISVTWPAIANEVNLADFIALEAIRLYEPALFAAIRERRDEVCGTRQDADSAFRDDARFERFVSEVPEHRRPAAKDTLQRLFPRLESMGYGHDWLSAWDAERRVCMPSHFDSYFRLSLSENALALHEIGNIIERADDPAFILATFRAAAAKERKRGMSMVPVYLGELTTHAARVDKAKVRPLLKALFEIHDEIDLVKDAEQEFGSMGNTSLRFHWLIRRLTADRFSLDERTALYLSALEGSALGWLVDFVSSASGDYVSREGRSRPAESCLVAERALAPLTTQALGAIRASAASGALLEHSDLLNILYRWRDFLGKDAKEARAWTDGLLTNDRALVIFARALTRESWSVGMGGLGDRVSNRSIVVRFEDQFDLVDLKAFRTGLDRILAQATMDAADLEVVRTFIRAWDQRSENHRIGRTRDLDLHVEEGAQATPSE